MKANIILTKGSHRESASIEGKDLAECKKKYKENFFRGQLINLSTDTSKSSFALIESDILTGSQKQLDHQNQS